MNTRFSTVLLICFLLFLVSPSSPLHSWYNWKIESFGSRVPEHDLRLEWWTRESDNFRIIYPAHLGEFACFIAAEAEDIFNILRRWTEFRPQRKIDILITDSNDFANGFVSRSTRGLFITFYAVYPYHSSSSGSDAYQSWYRNLLIHELSHVFHLDIVRGSPAVLNRIFGNIFYPNTCTPPFYIEGFATYSETVNESGYGRGRSPYTDMYIRTAISEENFPFLDQASNATTIWPSSQTRYLFGVSFVSYLSEEFGEERLLDFNIRGGAFPTYTWGIPFKKVYGKRLGKIWDEWKKTQQKYYSIMMNRVAEPGKTRLEPVGSLSGHVHSVCIDKSGKRVAFSGHPINGLGGLYIYHIETKKEYCVKKGLYGLDLSFSEDGGKLYFIGYDVYKNVNIKNNVYELDISTGRVRRITHRGNIQGFLLLEQENLLLLCVGTTFGTDIFFISHTDEVGNELISSRVNRIQSIENGSFAGACVIEEPALSPNGDYIAFSYKDTDGHRGICITTPHDLQRGRVSFKKITDVLYNAYSPCWINENELLFIADINEIYNLYSLNLQTGGTSRLSNVISGVFEPDISIDGTFIVKEYTSEGFRVSKGHIKTLGEPYWQETTQSKAFYPSQESAEDSELQKDLKSSVQDADSRDFSEDLKKTAQNGDNSILSENPQKTGKSKSYRPGRWLFPGYWLPFMAGDGIFLGIGFYTTGQDLLKKHVYKTALVYDVVDDTLKGLIDYTYNTALFSYFGRLFLSQPAEEESFEPEVAFYPGISYLLRKRNLFLQTELGVILENNLVGLNSSSLLSNLKGSDGWIGPERGFQFQHEMYYNLAQMNPFAVIEDHFSLYFKPFGFSLLNFSLKSKGGMGRKVLSGAYYEYRYIPLNALYTIGYSEKISGNFILDLKLTLGFPLLRVERGPSTFPLFFRGVNLYFFNDNGLIISDVDTTGFIITDIHDMASPFQHLRSSIGGELNWNFILGYEFPLSVKIGYVYTLFEGGRDGFYATMQMEFQF